MNDSNTELFSSIAVAISGLVAGIGNGPPNRAHDQWREFQWDG